MDCPSSLRVNRSLDTANVSKPFIVSCCLEERWGDVVNPWEMSFIAECCSGLKASFVFGSQIMVWGHVWITQKSWSVQCMRKCIE